MKGETGGSRLFSNYFVRRQVLEENAQVWKSSSSSGPHEHQNLTPVTRKI